MNTESSVADGALNDDAAVGDFFVPVPQRICELDGCEEPNTRSPQAKYHSQACNDAAKNRSRRTPAKRREWCIAPGCKKPVGLTRLKYCSEKCAIRARVSAWRQDQREKQRQREAAERKPRKHLEGCDGNGSNPQCCGYETNVTPVLAVSGV